MYTNLSSIVSVCWEETQTLFQDTWSWTQHGVLQKQKRSLGCGSRINGCVHERCPAKAVASFRPGTRRPAGRPVSMGPGISAAWPVWPWGLSHSRSFQGCAAESTALEDSTSSRREQASLLSRVIKLRSSSGKRSGRFLCSPSWKIQHPRLKVSQLWQIHHMGSTRLHWSPVSPHGMKGQRKPTQLWRCCLWCPDHHTPWSLNPGVPCLPQHPEHWSRLNVLKWSQQLSQSSLYWTFTKYQELCMNYVI